MPAPQQKTPTPAAKWTGTTSGEPLDPSAAPPEAQPDGKEEPPAAPSGEGEETPAPSGEGDKPRVKVSDLPDEALQPRLQAERQQLLKELGIEDPKKFVSEREQREQELARFRKEEEKRKRAAMSEQQKLQADLDAVRKERDELAQRFEQLEQERISDQQEAVVQRTAQKHVDPEMYAYARYEFVQHVQKLASEDPKALDELDEKAVDKFFRELVKQRPKFALAAGEAPKPPEPVKKPITTGPGPKAAPPAPAKGAPAGTSTDGKTFRPGQPNSMSKQEVREALRKQGLRGWS
jgi:hypothetical protein